jgi:hypothetical protein
VQSTVKGIKTTKKKEEKKRKTKGISR